MKTIERTATTTSEEAVPDGRRDTVAVEFTDVFRAHEAMLAAARLERRLSMVLVDSAVVTRDVRGRVRINRSGRPTPRSAAAWGAAWGWFLTFLFLGPLYGVVGAGLTAAAAATWARRFDGIDPALLRRIGDLLPPGGAAGVFMASHAHFAHVLAEVRRFRGRLMHSTLPTGAEADLAEALDAEC